MKKNLLFLSFLFSLMVASRYLIPTIAINANEITTDFEQFKTGVIGVSNIQDNSIHSTGTGFVYRQENNKYYAITNYHVILEYDQIQVTFEDDSYVYADVIGIDKNNDLSLISFSSDKQLHAFKFRDSDTLKLNEPVYAIGNPHGYNNFGTLTNGTINFLDKNLPIDIDFDGLHDTRIDLIEHSANIEKGSSGGPLIDLNGNVIGINSYKLEEQYISNVSYSIPSNTIKSFIITNSDLILTTLNQSNIQQKTYIDPITNSEILFEYHSDFYYNNDHTLKITAKYLTGMLKEIYSITITAGINNQQTNKEFIIHLSNGETTQISDMYGSLGTNSVSITSFRIMDNNGNITSKTLTNPITFEYEVNEKQTVSINDFKELPNDSGKMDILTYEDSPYVDVYFDTYDTIYIKKSVLLPEVVEYPNSYVYSWSSTGIGDSRKIYLDFENQGRFHNKIIWEVISGEYLASNYVTVTSKVIKVNKNGAFVYFNTNIQMDEIYKIETTFDTYNKLLGLEFNRESHNLTILSDTDINRETRIETFFSDLFNKEPVYAIETSEDTNYNYKAYLGDYKNIEDQVFINFYYITNGSYYSTEDGSVIDNTIDHEDDSLLSNFPNPFNNDKNTNILYAVLIIIGLLLIVPILISIIYIIKTIIVPIKLIISIFIFLVKLPLLLVVSKKKNKYKYKY